MMFSRIRIFDLFPASARPVILATIVALACAAVAFRSASHETLYAVVLFNRTAIVGASSMKSGLFFSTDRGDTWHHTGWNNVRAFGMAADGDNLYLAAGNGIHRSTDAGAHWKIVTDWRITEAQRIAVEADHRSLVAATAHGVWRSGDRGDSWVACNDGLRSTFTSALAVDTTNPMIFAGTDEGLFAWSAREHRWQAAPDSAVSHDAVLALLQHPRCAHELYAATETRGIARSTDGGAHWTTAAHGLPATAFYVIAAAADRCGTLYTAGLNSGVWRSTDDGATWTEIGHESLAGKSFHGLAVSTLDPRVIYAGEYNGGVWRSTDAGETWKNVGLPGSQIWELRMVNQP